MMSKNKHDNYQHGYYIPKYPDKYKGKGNPFYRSSYERRAFFYMDTSVNILAWASELTSIPYLYEVDGKFHRYYPDIFCKVRLKNGDIEKYIIEIKPYKQTIEPEKPKNRNKKRLDRYKYEYLRFIKNVNKWDATEKYCKKHGYKFEILTEKNLWNR